METILFGALKGVGTAEVSDSLNRPLNRNLEEPNNVWEVAQLLTERYRDFDHHNRKNPLDELLFIICSTKTDVQKYRNTHKALKQKFPRFRQIAAASESEIAAAIVDGGLYNQKAKVIKKIFNELEQKFGRPTLAPLRYMSDDECETILLSLPGVGKKTARCILMYSFKREVFPVDTHCWRITQRLGWITPTCHNGRCYPVDMDRLQEVIPPSLRRSLHVNLISLGREICTSRSPACSLCPLNNLCPKYGTAMRKHAVSDTSDG